MTSNELLIEIKKAADLLVTVNGTLMMVATSSGNSPKQPPEHESDCNCQICKAYLAVEEVQQVLECVEKHLKDANQ